MIVTHKRSLVEDTDAPILSYDDITPGDQSTSPSIQSLNILYQHTLSTHPLNTPSPISLSYLSYYLTHVVLSYDDITPGRSALGVVSKISEDGLKIHFYNDVKGLVTMAVLVKQGVVDVAEAYRVGQVVRHKYHPHYCHMTYAFSTANTRSL